MGKRLSAAGVAALLISLSVLPSCSTEAPQESPTTPTAPPTPAATYATTGLTVPSGRPLQPVLAVKVDDTPAGRPQQGVDRADAVIQEPVEGGLTRLMAFFESRRPESVGPVRSLRTTDIPLVQTIDATTVASGASPSVLAAFESEQVPLVVEGAEAFVRNPERIAPYNLYVDASQVGRVEGDRVSRRALMRFGELNLPGGRGTEQIEVEFSPAVTDQWTLGGGDRWRRSDRERPFAADTLVILGVGVRDTGKQDAAGSAVPEVTVVGNGAGFLVVGDRVHVVKWRKRRAQGPFLLSTKAGLTVEVPPGRSWIILLPKDTGKVSFD